MHDESLNTRSFARRASPQKDRLPASYGTSSVFCNSCRTNQTLTANLLANYLPAPDDPEYARRAASLPAYRASLEKRYPSVCPACLPAVEEEIKRRDHMARTNALGVLLKNSKGKGKERQRQSSGSHAQRNRATLEKDMFLWRIRGVLWSTTLVLVLSCYICALTNYAPLRLSPSIRTTAPLPALLSLLWTAWDPRYATFRRSQLQGREVRLRRKREYNILQSLAWASRVITAVLLSISTFKPSWIHFYHVQTTISTLPISLRRSQWYCIILLALELGVLLRSAMILRIDRPPPVRLMEQFSYRPSLPPSDTSSAPESRLATPAVDTAPDLLSTLTLSNNPVLAGPVFGVPSFAQRMNGHAADGCGPADAIVDMDDAMDEDDERERDPDAMDWTPASPAAPPRTRTENVLLRPQRFFPREEPTGLESLFAETIKLSDDDIARLEEQQRRGLLGWVRTKIVG